MRNQDEEAQQNCLKMSLCLPKPHTSIPATRAAFLPLRKQIHYLQEAGCAISVQSPTASSYHPSLQLIWVFALYSTGKAEFDLVVSLLARTQGQFVAFSPGECHQFCSTARQPLHDKRKIIGVINSARRDEALMPSPHWFLLRPWRSFYLLPVPLQPVTTSTGSTPDHKPWTTFCKRIHFVFNTTVN